MIDLRAYHATSYEAAGAIARIGRRSAPIDALLRRMGVRQGGFVTAWNPSSRRHAQGWNRRMQSRLAAAARRLPQAAGQGAVRSARAARRWSEAHLLLGADPRRLRVPARRFRQAAIVVVARGAPARLAILPAAGDAPTARLSPR